MEKVNLILNTFDSFIKYSEINKLPLTRDSNEDFFYYLGKAIEYHNIPIKNGTINSIVYFGTYINIWLLMM